MQHFEQTNEHTDIKGEAAPDRCSELLDVLCLAQGYLSSALKVSWHQHTF